MFDRDVCLDPECGLYIRSIPHFHRTFLLSRPTTAARSAREYKHAQRRAAINAAQSRSCDGHNCDYGRD